MLDKKREIYIRVTKLKEIVEKLEQIKEKNSELRDLFDLYDKLDHLENEIFENWNYYLEDVSEKMDHLSL